MVACGIPLKIKYTVCIKCGFWRGHCEFESILGDLGAVSPVGRKNATKVFKYGRKSPWVPTLTELFPKIQTDTAS